jgi:alkylation response protein AidB-like acyl-CoA dehydrogenase
MGTTLLDRIDGITGLVREQADEIEAQRRISDDVVAAIRGTGLNRGMIPKELGGDQLHLLDMLEAIEHLAAADGSTGWCAAIGSGSNLFAGFLDRDAAGEVFADVDSGNAGMFGPFGQARPTGDGTYEMSGRWPFSSNCLHSTWIGVGTFFLDESGEPNPIPRVVYVPMSDVDVEETWTAQGLCGTGSHHTKVTSWTTKMGYSTSLIDQAWADGPMYRMPMFCNLAPALGIVPLGIARGALDEVGRMVREGSSSTRATLVDDPFGMSDYAVASARLQAARSGIEAAAARAWDLAERGEPVDKVTQAKLMLAVNQGCDVAVEVTGTAHRLAGGPAAYAGHVLLRALRDVETARQHIMFGHLHRPVLGQALAGLDVFAPPFIV